MGKILNEKQLAKRLKYWKKKLGLSDWEIDLHIVRQRDIGGDYAGRVWWTLPNKQATINLIDPSDYPPHDEHNQDMEKTLVHELMHLHHAPISDHYGKECSQYSLYEEWAINAATEALIKLERKE